MLIADQKQALIEKIRHFPETLTSLVSNLTDEQLRSHYLPGEWSVQQIVHHLADSHMNSILRLKFILTMDQPHLQGYPEKVWAELPDVDQTPIENSLLILRGLHQRWAALFENLRDEQWKRVGIHSERGKISAENLLTDYVEHCDIHLDQIKRVLQAGAQL